MVVSILPHAEFGPNDHKQNAPNFIHFSKNVFLFNISNWIDCGITNTVLGILIDIKFIPVHKIIIID